MEGAWWTVRRSGMLISYLREMLRVFFHSITALGRAPGTALMTITAIGITLSLPALLYVVTENVDQFTGGWQGQAQVNLFLARDVQDPGAIEQQLGSLASIERVEAISPDEGLADFKRHSGFSQAAELLDSNPLPWTLVAHLSGRHSDIDSVERFMEQAAGLAGVAHVRSDVLWLKRLAAMVEIGRRLVWVLAVLLGLAVVVIISNTVRLAIMGRAHEIEVIKLVGATDRFIRRPFLYQGFIQGALGAVMAVVLVTLCIEALRAPITELVSAYGSDYRVLGLSWGTAGVLLLLGSGLGWLASRWSVGRHLKDIEPR